MNRNSESEQGGHGHCVMHLTARQVEIVRLAASGLSSKQIARLVRISSRTVDDHLFGMRRRLGAADRGELIARFYAEGILVDWPPRWSGAERLSSGRRSEGGPEDFNQRRPAEYDRHLASWSGREGQATLPDARVALPAQLGGASYLASPGVTVLKITETEAASGELVGYAWAPASDQSAEQQLNALAAIGCSRVFIDDSRAANLDRPALRYLINHTRPGDALVVASLDRVCQSVVDLLMLAAQLRSRGVEFKSLREPLDTTSPSGWMIFQVLTALTDSVHERNAQGAGQCCCRQGRERSSKGHAHAKPQSTAQTQVIVCG
jgi:DNA-binding CsgD family transcriptional regulator